MIITWVIFALTVCYKFIVKTLNLVIVLSVITMTQNNQFLEDLERGFVEEKKVYNYYKKLYPMVKHISGYEKKYDIMIPEKFSVEVKFDERSMNTGNYFIEAFYQNEKSGINATTAKLWVISNGKQYLFINTKDIKKCIKNKPLKTTILFDRKVDFYLIRKYELEELGKFIKIA